MSREINEIQKYHLVLLNKDESLPGGVSVKTVYEGQADSYKEFLREVVPDYILENYNWEVRTTMLSINKDEAVHDGIIEEVTD